MSGRRIAQILERALPKRGLKSFEPLTGGDINLSYLLRFDETEAPVVLRIFVRDPSACQKEVGLLRSVSKLLPVPQVLCAPPKGEDDVGPYVLYS